MLNFIKLITNNMESLRDIWQFLKDRKKYWLAPVIIMVLLLGLLIIFTSGSTLTPFIYTIF